MAFRRLSLTRLVLFLVVILILLAVNLLMRKHCDCYDIDQMALKIQGLKQQIGVQEEQLKQRRKQSDDDDVEDNLSWGPHKLAVIVPFRERFEELMEFVPFMHKFFNMQKVRHHIYIVNQMDNFRFNRAALINIGFLQSKETCDYMVMHDVDLLPRNRDLSYHYDKIVQGPHHIAAPEIHPRYHYKTFIGGILMLKREHYLEVNGMSNKFWGWGREDDEFYLRLKKVNLEISKPEGINTGPEDTFYHIHDSKKRKRDMVRVQNQKQEQFRKDLETGLDSVDYKLLSKQTLKVDGASCTILHVNLKCDKEVTPWCEHEAR